jgi:hypothetical protein
MLAFVFKVLIGEEEPVELAPEALKIEPVIVKYSGFNDFAVLVLLLDKVFFIEAIAFNLA